MTTLFLVFVALTGFASAPASAVLTKYDDFENAGASATLWTADSPGVGVVTFTGTNAEISLPSGTAPKYARIIANNLQPSLVENGDTYHMSWDQQLTADLSKAYRIGLAFLDTAGDPTAPMLLAGQFGAGPSDSSQDQEFLLGALGGETHSNLDPAYNNYHYDLTLLLNDKITGSVTAVMETYTHDGLFDNSPEDYLTSGSLLSSITETHDWSDTTDLQLVFASTFFGPNTSTSTVARGTFLVDNVFVDLPPVPEPGTMLLLGTGLLLLQIKKRKRTV